MDFVQGPITTLHRLDGPGSPPIERPFSAIVPMVEREMGRSTAETVVEAVLDAGARRVVVPLRADASVATRMAAWLSGLDPAVEVIWCNAEGVSEAVADLPARPTGKGGDVWLALGPAARDVEVVCCFDADVEGATADDVRRLVAPVDGDLGFVKAYYARLDRGRPYGRLFRLLYRPLVAALGRATADPVIDYLADFRYALAGEFAVETEAALEWSMPNGMGLEVATLGEAYETPGPDGAAQVDLGVHRHDHRTVAGAGGLEAVAPAVAGALAGVLERRASTPIDWPTPEAYRTTAAALVRRYARDARFNALRYDPVAEREQVERYAAAVADPDDAAWLPPWSAVDVDPTDVLRASDRSLGVATDAAGNI
ncbi:MAG: glycosyl transferase family 2 [Halobacteriales archaeon]